MFVKRMLSLEKVILLFFILISFACSSGLHSTLPARPELIKEQQLNFTLRQPKSWKLENGLEVIYLFDDEVPLQSGKLYYRGGSLAEPASLRGLAQAFGSQLREGGVKGIAPDELDQKLDSLGAAIESSSGDEFSSVGFFSLDQDFEQIFQLFSKVIREPTFNQTRLDLWKKHALDSINRRRDDPNLMANMTFLKVIYGAGSPYSEAPNKKSISAISIKTIEEFFHKFLRPQGAILTISGSVPEEKVRAAVERYFGSWKDNRLPLPVLPPVTNKVKAGIYLLPRDFSQSTIVIGQLGPPRLTPDMFQMNIFNRVYGNGDLGSLLVDEVRTKLGLAYVVAGELVPGPVAGAFEIQLGTRNTEAVRAIAKVFELTKKIQTELVDSAQVSDAKSAVQHSFVFKFSSPKAVVERAAVLKLLQYPKDFDERYLEKISNVTPEGVREVAQRWINTEQLAVVIVGKQNLEDIKKMWGGKLPIYQVRFETTPEFEEVSG